MGGEGLVIATHRSEHRVEIPFKLNARRSEMGPIATKLDCSRHVRFAPVSDRNADIAGRLKGANSGSDAPHSITSSARLRTVGVMVKPRTLAVLRFRINSNLVGNSIGSSAGAAPLKILSTNAAQRE
jgi:hypothetical protein